MSAMMVRNPPVRRLADWSAERLAGLADEFGTPLYVLDLDRVRENYRRMADAFPDAEIYYAAKANTARPVLRALADEGAGVECASAGELARVLDAGVPGERVHYTAVNPPARDLDVAVELAAEHPDLTITAGAADTIDRLAERGYDGRLCLRVNPGVGAGHHEKVATGADAKFGVPYDRAVDLLETTTADFEVVGVHAHAGSGISGDDLSAHRELVSRMGDLARAVEDRGDEVDENRGVEADDYGIDLEFVDVGGGFGVPYRPDDDPLDLEAVAEATREALGETAATLAVEPGRYLVADAGVLLTEVNTVKETPSGVVVGVGAGMTTLARPAIYDAHHEMRNCSAEREGQDEGRDENRPNREVTVAGPVCESADTFGDHWLPEPRRGDLLAIGNAGAYGYEMASHYNSRPRPASVVLTGDSAQVARQPEGIADVTAVEPEVDR